MSMNRPFDGEESVEYGWIVSYRGQRTTAYDDTEDGRNAALAEIKRGGPFMNYTLSWGIV